MCSTNDVNTNRVIFYIRIVTIMVMIMMLMIVMIMLIILLLSSLLPYYVSRSVGCCFWLVVMIRFL